MMYLFVFKFPNIFDVCYIVTSSPLYLSAALFLSLMASVGVVSGRIPFYFIKFNGYC